MNATVVQPEKGKGTHGPFYFKGMTIMRRWEFFSIWLQADVIKTHHNDTELVRKLRANNQVVEPLTEFHKVTPPLWKSNKPSLSFTTEFS